ncbi:MAG: winged helix-turn-helix transcriptional regulator [Eubacterium sp.]|nr:winged helix-turn-helix transcriptional regulator [Eubacterium sp.]
MEDRVCDELREFNRIYKEFDDLWHETALHIGLSDSAFDILYSVYCLGDGCLQRDICALSFGRKQTINSAIQKLVKEGMLLMKQGKGREMHIYLTEAGKDFVKQKVEPLVEIENSVWKEMPLDERQELIRLTKQYVDGYHSKVRMLIADH